MKIFLLLSYCVSILMAGCVAEQRSPSRAEQHSEHLASSARIAKYLKISDAKIECGNNDSKIHPNQIIAISAKQCMSCRSVGSMVRRLLREAEHDKQVLWVATSVDDAEAVCQFLNQERVRINVAVLPDSVLPDTSITHELVHVAFTPARTVLQVVAGKDGADLIARRRASKISVSDSTVRDSAPTRITQGGL